MGKATLTQIAGYRLVAKIGEGGMGRVYVGRRRGDPSAPLVAVKVGISRTSTDEGLRRSFVAEARTASSLVHPNIVRVFEAGEVEDIPYLVMEYIEGVSLRALILRSRERSRPLNRQVLATILDDTLTALEAAHEHVGPDGTVVPIVHRDVNPHNVIVGIDGIARLADFGIARAQGSAGTTKSGMIKGKLSYIAPELLAGAQPSTQTDIFSAGVMAWEMFVDRPLFDAEDDVATLAKILTSQVPAPTELDPTLPPEVDAVVMNALAPIAERYPTARVFREAVRSLRTITSGSEPRLGPTSTPSLSRLLSLGSAGHIPVGSTPSIGASGRRSVAAAVRELFGDDLRALRAAAEARKKRKPRSLSTERMALGAGVVILGLFAGIGWAATRGPLRLGRAPEADAEPASRQDASDIVRDSGVVKAAGASLGDRRDEVRHDAEAPLAAGDAGTADAGADASHGGASSGGRPAPVKRRPDAGPVPPASVPTLLPGVYDP